MCSSRLHQVPLEVAALRRLPWHPNIAQLLDYDVIGGKHYLVTEACGGGELFTLVGSLTR